MPLIIANAKPEGYLYAAYRPMVLQTILDYPDFSPVPDNPPVIFCDVYFNNVYYKTLSSTVFESVNTSLVVNRFRSMWTFDIQDAAQEYLRSRPQEMRGNVLIADTGSIATFRVAFRTSAVDANGFTIPQAPAPVQGNFRTQPVSGGGLLSSFYVVANATLQHEDNQDLLAHLSYYTATYPPSSIKSYSITHRKEYVVGIKQYDHWPVLIPYKGLAGLNAAYNVEFYIIATYRDGTTQSKKATGVSSIPYAPIIFYIPSGIPQLRTLAWDGGPPDWDRIVNYHLYLSYPGSTDFFDTGKIVTTGCTCESGARIRFLNGLGTYDSVNFCEREEVLNTKSSNWQKGLPLLGLQKKDFGNQRFGVHANEEVKVRSNTYSEGAQEWLKELAQSTRAYLEWPGGQGALPDLIPIKILDGKVVTRKTVNRYEYLLEISFEMANENIVHRG